MTQQGLRAVIRIVDDEPAVLRSESFLVGMLGWQTACYSSSEDFLEKFDPLQPGCLIADIRMPGLSGLELLEEMKRRDIDLPVIFLTGHGDIEMAVHAMQAGALDFLVKPAQPERLKAVLEKACAQSLAQRALNQEKQRRQARYQTLTAGEKQTMPLLAQGLSNKEAAEQLGISAQAVKIRRSAIMEKLQLATNVDMHEFLKGLEP